MRSIWATVVAVSYFGTVAADTRFCKQDEKQLANKLHDQNTEPAKSCYRAANGDITTLDTSRLCPLPECASWLAYMADNSPDCYYDSSNYAIIYAAKSADCTGDTTTSISGSTSPSAVYKSSSEASSSAMNEDRALNATAIGSIDGSLTSAESASNELDADVATPTPTEDLTIDTTAPTPPPTEDSTIEETTTPPTESSSSTPAPTSSASSLVSSLATLFLAAAAAIYMQL